MDQPRRPEAARWAAEAVHDSDGEVLAVHATETFPELLGETFTDAASGLGIFSPGGTDPDELRHLIDHARRPLIVVPSH